MAEGGRERPGGYNKHWFIKREKALEYRCGICDHVLKDPQQIMVCGHQFCLLCLQGTVEKCPTCDKDVTPNGIFPDTSAKLKILNLHIRCPSNQCTWKGKCHDFEETHKRECPQELVECSNETCTEVVTQVELQRHLQEECQYREIDCRHCARRIIIADEHTHYEEHCLRIPVACPQLCDNEIPREEVQNHVNDDCEKTLIDCTFKTVGCDVQVERANLQEHLDTTIREHLSQARCAVENLQQEKQNMANEIARLESSNNDLANELRHSSEQAEERTRRVESDLREFQEVGTIGLEGVQQATEQNFDSLNQIVLQAGEFQETLLCIQHELTRMTTIVVPQLQSTSDTHENNMRTLPEKLQSLRRLIAVVHNKFINDITSLRDDMDVKLHTLHEKVEDERNTRMENGTKTEEELSKLGEDIVKNRRELDRQNMALTVTKDEMGEDLMRHTQQMQIDYENLSEKIAKEKQSREHDFKQLNENISSANTSGTSVWRVDNIESFIIQANKTSHGNAFYTEPHGYQLQPKIFFNGVRQNDDGYISVFIKILKGKFDPILKWPFQKRIRFTLIEQESEGFRRDIQKDLIPDPDAEEFRRPSENANGGFGIYKFVSHEVLRAGRYIVDDAIFVKIEVIQESERHSETI